MLFGWEGGPKVPGHLGYPFVFATINAQIQFSQMIIQTTGPKTIIINMVWGTRRPGTLEIFIFLRISNDQQTNPMLQKDHPNHQITKYNN